MVSRRLATWYRVWSSGLRFFLLCQTVNAVRFFVRDPLTSDDVLFAISSRATHMASMLCFAAEVATGPCANWRNASFRDVAAGAACAATAGKTETTNSDHRPGLFQLLSCVHR